jgi:WD40 repeat protein
VRARDAAQSARDAAEATNIEERAARAAALATQPGKAVEALDLAVGAYGRATAGGRAPGATVLTALYTTLSTARSWPTIGEPSESNEWMTRAISSDGQIVAQLGGAAGDVIVWDTPAMAEPVVAGFGEPGLYLDWLADGSSVLVSGASRVALFDAADGRELWSMKGRLLRRLGEGKSTVVALIDDRGDLVLARPGSAAPPPLRLEHETPTFAHLATSTWYQPYNYSPGAELLAIIDDRRGATFDTATGARVAELRGVAPRVKGVYFIDAARLLTYSFSGTLQHWDARTGKELFHTELHVEGPWPAELSPDGKLFATGACETPVKLRDPRGVPVVEVETSGCRATFGFSRDSSLAFFGKLEEVSAYDARTGREVARLAPQGGFLGWVTSSATDGRLASASEDGVVRVFQPDGKKLFELRGHSGAALSLAFSPDGKRVASTGNDGTVRIWDTRPLEPRLRLPSAPQGDAGLIATTLPGARILTATRDGRSLQLWDVHAGRVLRSFEPPAGPPRVLRSSPDGSTALAAVGESVQLWDVATGKLRTTVATPGAEAMMIAYSPAAHRLAIAAGGWGVRVLDELGASVRDFPDLPSRYLTFSADGGSFTTSGCPSHRAQIAGDQRPQPLGEVNSCAVSYFGKAPDGAQRLFVCGTSMQVLDEAGKLLHTVAMPLDHVSFCDVPFAGPETALFHTFDGRMMLRPLDLETNLRLACRTLRHVGPSADAAKACEGR